MDRRKFIRQSALSGLALSALPTMSFNQTTGSEYQVHQITNGQVQHWFGYYDKWQIDPTGRYALGMEVGMIFRSPQPGDVIKIGLIDLEYDNRWKEIGTTKAWSWQQGCMLQWIPGSTEEVIWNDREGDGFISRVYNIKSGKSRKLPRAVYTLSPDGTFGLSVNFARLQDMRPGYGYAVPGGVGDLQKAPDHDGIYRMDLRTGESKLIISLEKLSKLSRPLGSVADNFHWCNHLLVNPAGDRFIFLNRSRPYRVTDEMKKEPDWVSKYVSRKHVTRAVTANVDGSGIYVLNDSGYFSHFIWKDNEVVAAWAMPEDNDREAFYRFFDKTKNYELIAPEKMPYNGHNTYVPNTNNEWILNDTYPLGEERLQHLYLFHVPTKKRVDLGSFHQPPKFYSEWRCDLHPRCDQQGKRVFFDSTHNDDQRQMYMIDIEKIVRG